MPQRKVNPYTLFKLYNLDFCSRIQAVGTLGFNIYIYIYINITQRNVKAMYIIKLCNPCLYSSKFCNPLYLDTHIGFVLKCNPWLYNPKVKKNVKPI